MKVDGIKMYFEISLCCMFAVLFDLSCLQTHAILTSF